MIELKVGDQIRVNRAIVAITEELEDRFLGVYIYKGIKTSTEALILKSTLSNPHYQNIEKL